MHILIDIGGTKTRIAGTADAESFGEPVIIETSPVYEDSLAAVERVSRDIADGAAIESCTVGIACMLGKDKRTIVNHHNLAGWNGREFARDLEERLGAPATLENDAANVGLGEAVFGAGRGAPILVYVTVSTGVNGARITNGAVDPSAFGFEIGGQYLHIGDRPATLEEMVSGRAIEAKYGVLPRDLGKESPVWEELSLVMAYALNNTILHWSPDRVVLGGSMFNEIGIPVPRIAEHLGRVSSKFDSLPELVHSELGDLGGLWGSLARLRRSRGASGTA